MKRRRSQLFSEAQRLENDYLRHLKEVTRHIDSIVRGFVRTNEVETHAIEEMLNRYADFLRPWAQRVSYKMIQEVSKKNDKAWIALSRTLGTALAEEIKSAPTGQIARELMEAQVDLITSLPRDAAQRIQKLAFESVANGTRVPELIPEILASGEVSYSRAKLIARTEIARSQSTFTMARAKHVGSTHYIWRTSMDSSVRQSHREMEGKIIAYDEEPVLSDGTKTHAGCIYNCRCFPEPIITEEDV